VAARTKYSILGSRFTSLAYTAVFTHEHYHTKKICIYMANSKTPYLNKNFHDVMSSTPKKLKPPVYNQYAKLPKDLQGMIDSFKPKQKDCECDCDKPIPHTIQTKCEGTCRQKCCKHLRFETLLDNYFNPWLGPMNVHFRQVADFIDKHPCVLRAGYRTPLATIEHIWWSDRGSRGTLHETLTTCIIRKVHARFAQIHWINQQIRPWRVYYDYSEGISSTEGTLINGRVNPDLSIEKCRARLSPKWRNHLKIILAKCKVLLRWVFRQEPLLARNAYLKDVSKEWSNDKWYQKYGPVPAHCNWIPPIFLLFSMVPILTDLELKGLCEVFIDAWPKVIYIDFGPRYLTTFEALRYVMKHTLLVKTSKTNTEKLLFGGLKGLKLHPLGGVFGDKIVPMLGF